MIIYIVSILHILFIINNIVFYFVLYQIFQIFIIKNSVYRLIEIYHVIAKENIKKLSQKN